MGLSILEGAKNITVSGVTSKEMWGDGFYVESAQGVTFCSVVADHNRRQGLSVIEVDRLEVMNSVFSNTQGTRPSAGIDLEPDDVKQQISNVRIHNSKFLNNKGPGILVAGKKHASLISRLEITENLFVGELPLKIEYSPEVLQSQICRNRQIVREVAIRAVSRPIKSPKRFSSFSTNAATTDCKCAADDRRLLVHRGQWRRAEPRRVLGGNRTSRLASFRQFQYLISTQTKSENSEVGLRPRVQSKLLRPDKTSRRRRSEIFDYSKKYECGPAAAQGDAAGLAEF